MSETVDCGVLEPLLVRCLELDPSLDTGTLSMSLKAELPA